MTRRQAWIAVLGLFAAFPTRVAFGEGGQLTIDLDLWQVIRVKHAGKVVEVTPAQIFEALR